MSKITYTCHVVFHTHWDREWYFPFEVFRHRFTQVMDRVLDGLENNEFNTFVLDGQMSVLEDFFEVCEPERKKYVEELITKGRIVIGPWYVLADEFLVSGESLIRNLELGIQMAKKFGRPQQIGYLPDTFGHTGQMPQILQGFGLDNAILWRGICAKNSEFTWRAPDGSEVFTVFLPEGYYQPIVDRPYAGETLKTYLDKVKGFASTPHMLLTNGGDHLMPRYGDIRSCIYELNEQLQDIELIQSDFEQYAEAVKNSVIPDRLPVHVGEMRNNEHIYLLPNILSSRSYLKTQNQQIEDEITAYTEPLLSMAAIEKASYPYRYLEQTWKLLLRNHPHDSICGCSVDEVHADMENRTVRLGQRVAELQKQAIMDVDAFSPAESGTALVKTFDDDRNFLVYNPHLYPYTGWVEGTIWLNEPADFIVDQDNNPCNTVILSQSRAERFASPLDGFPEFIKGWEYKIAFLVNHLPGGSLTTFKLKGGETKKLSPSYSNVLENQYIKITLEKDGTLTLLDKRSRTKYIGMNQFYSSLDAGDEYNYSPPEHDHTTIAQLVNYKVNTCDMYQTLSYKLNLNLPIGLNVDRTGATAETVTTEIHVMLTLREFDTTVESDLTVRNRAMDQRLRVKLPVGTDIDFTYSDTAFELKKRPAKKLEKLDAKKGKEVPVVVEPSQSTIRSGEKERGIHLFHRGLQEYQITTSRLGDTAEVTILRSIGWLSRDDLRTRGGGAGPRLKTEGAQCLGTYHFQYAFGPIDHELPEQSLALARKFRLKPRIYRGKLREKMKQLIEVSNPIVQVSAVRIQDSRLLVRLWNPSTYEQKVEFSRLYGGIHAVERIRLDGMNECALGLKDGGWVDRIPPSKINTYLFTIEEEVT